MNETYPPGVQEQIKHFLEYRDGKQMVERYLAMLNSDEYLGRSPNCSQVRGRGKKTEKLLTCEY